MAARPPPTMEVSDVEIKVKPDLIPLRQPVLRLLIEGLEMDRPEGRRSELLFRWPGIVPRGLDPETDEFDGRLHDQERCVEDPLRAAFQALDGDDGVIPQGPAKRAACCFASLKFGRSPSMACGLY